MIGTNVTENLSAQDRLIMLQGQHRVGAAPDRGSPGYSMPRPDGIGLLEKP